MDAEYLKDAVASKRLLQGEGMANQQDLLRTGKAPKLGTTPPSYAVPCGVCHKCLDGIYVPFGAGRIPVTRQRFIVCAICGCKRCPHATDCANACTKSNEPGQPGSVFE